VPPATRDDTVAVLGLGDLGSRVVDALARLPLGRVVAVARDPARAAQVTGQAAVVAGLCDGPGAIEAATADLRDVEGTAALLARLQPSVIVVAASRHTWWRSAPALAALPYGAWLPLHVGVVRDAVRARDLAGIGARVVGLPFPDAVGPVLAADGVAPDVGAGNVAEIAAKLQLLAARAAGVGREAVDVRLIAHHATERLAFTAFSELAGDVEEASAGPPPYRGEVRVDGEPLPDERFRALFTAPHPLLEGRETHAITAAATAGTVLALLAEQPRLIHVPAPAGLPGGYPVLAARDSVVLALPDGTREGDAVAVNAVAARWDGLERIAPDGTVTFTRAVADATQTLLGRRLERVAAGEMDEVADDLAARAAAV
jgi:hypothetical protein